MSSQKLGPRSLLTSLATFLCFVIGSSAHASLYLGSFNNDPSGQDTPVARIIAAIFAADGVNISDLTGLYKNNYANDLPSVTSDPTFPLPNGFTLTGNDQAGTISINATPGYDPLYYTVKIDGQNAGFNLYKFNEDVTHAFDNIHFGDGAEGVYYESDSWSTSGDMTTLGISHVTVWGRQAVIPEASTFAIWAVMGVIGFGYTSLRRRRDT